jgi:hypothetical protein
MSCLTGNGGGGVACVELGGVRRKTVKWPADVVWLGSVVPCGASVVTNPLYLFGCNAAVPRAAGCG